MKDKEGYDEPQHIFTRGEYCGLFRSASCSWSPTTIVIAMKQCFEIYCYVEYLISVTLKRVIIIKQYPLEHSNNFKMVIQKGYFLKLRNLASDNERSVN